MTRVRWMQVLALLLAAASADARTWRVEKDGSGDFMRLYEASVAAASGDTITIGPGLYLSPQLHHFADGSFEVHGVALVEELTILGAGAEGTILGEPAGPGNFDSPYGIVGDSNTRLTVRGIRFADLGQVIWNPGISLTVSDCSFERNWSAIASMCSDFQVVEDCQFLYGSGTGAGGIIVHGQLPSRRARIERCQFRGVGTSVQVQSKESVVRDCYFESTSVSAAQGGELLVSNCEFVGLGGAAEVLDYPSILEVRNSRFKDKNTCLGEARGGRLRAFDNVLEGGGFATVVMGGRGPGNLLQGNHILHGAGRSVAVVGLNGGDPLIHHDFRNNYWGTEDPAQIAAWIHDANDDPNLAAIIDFEPFSPVPLATRPKSFGEMRALFGPREEP